jgi:(aminoalkyl)phosphonate N-acetyltransferase
MSESAPAPPGAVVVRQAEPGDSQDAVRLLLQLGYDRSATAVEDDLRTGAAGLVYVAVAEERVIGLLALSVHRQFHWGGLVASVEALVVDQTIRSRGVGATLLATGIARAQQEGCILIELHSNRRRRRAHQFYKRHGFDVTSAYFVRHLR